ncbi:MAG: MFS transporter [Selenomonas sp.]|nr:MFS transporter [Selenomonas sp.]
MLNRFVDVFKQFKVNRPLVVLSLFFIILFGMMAVMNSIGTYFITYNCNRPDLIQWFGLIGTLPAFFLLPLVPTFNKLVGKINLLRISLTLGIIGCAVTYVVPAENITAIMVARFIGSCGIIVAGGFMWALIPETIEYGEYKTGKRLSGMIYAIIGFFFKFGLALGGIVPGFMLARFGYVANQVQTPEALEGILLTSTIIPIIFLVLAFIDICFYGLDDKRYQKIVTELEQRHQQEKDSADESQLSASTL